MLISLRALLMLSLIPFLCGCVGIGVLYPKNSTTIEHPYIGATVGHYMAGGLSPSIKCSKINSWWGEPNDSSLNNNETTLIYKNGFVWAGVLPAVLVPIPLVLPVGRKTTTLICKDDEIIRASGSETGFFAAYCGLLGTRPDYGCKVE